MIAISRMVSIADNELEIMAIRAQGAELKPMQQSWRSVLPCEDCECIETSLFLEKDGTWMMNERYQKRAQRTSLLCNTVLGYERWIN